MYDKHCGDTYICTIKIQRIYEKTLSANLRLYTNLKHSTSCQSGGQKMVRCFSNQAHSPLQLIHIVCRVVFNLISHKYHSFTEVGLPRINIIPRAIIITPQIVPNFARVLYLLTICISSKIFDPKILSDTFFSHTPILQGLAIQ